MTNRNDTIAPHLTVEERTERGRAVRSEVPRSAHAVWEPAADRRDPVDLLEEQAATRVPELVPLRYGRMLVSPFTFYRGAAYLMAADLSGLPRTDLETQLCGDAHLSNFGTFAAPDRTLVFDCNDFDETLPGPFEWDLKRLAASVAIAGRDRGFAKKVRASVNLEVGRSYREALRGRAAERNLDLWYSRVHVEEILAGAAQVGTKKQLKRAEKNVAKARSKDSLRAFGKLTETVGGEPRIRNEPPGLIPIHELFDAKHHRALDKALRTVIRSYRRTLSGDRRRLLERFHYADAARKVVGVGSVGTRAWIMLMVGRDHADPLFLQFKEAEASVLEPFLGPSKYEQHGQRVVEGQRLMQAAGDIMLGWVRTSDVDGIERDYYVRQLWDAKGSALVETMNPTALTYYAGVCGRTLARAHARAGDSVAIASYLGKGDSFDRALAGFAEAYADQNERDYAAVVEAVESGRITTETEA
jgi:uncharacterized protein (DUF2252 family)